MERREYLAVLGCGLAGSAAGCVGGSEPTDVDGEFLEAESSSDVDISDHSFMKTGETTQPYTAVGTASHSTGQHETMKVTANFLDSDATRITNSYNLLTNLTSDQYAEFTV